MCYWPSGSTRQISKNLLQKNNGSDLSSRVNVSLNSYFRLPLALLLSALLGTLHTTTFAPLSAWWLQALTLGGLFALTQIALPQQRQQRRNAFWIGWLFGLGWFLSGVSWVYISMHDYGGMPSVMAALATLLFCAFLALFPACACLLFNTLKTQQARWWNTSLLFAACWALSEWLRGLIFTGFPWISTGSAHVIGPLRGYVPMLGMYGTALLAAWVAALCSISIQMLLARERRAYALAGICVMACLTLGTALAYIPWTQPQGKPLQVRLLQGNIPQDLKFDLGRFHETFHRYGQLISQQPADLIVLPETALPQLWSSIDPNFKAALQQFSDSTGSHLVIGVPLADDPTHYTNSALLLSPQRKTSSARYDKTHLVPFGEFVPFGFHWFVEMMNIPLGDFSHSTAAQATFAVADQRIAPNICYEDLFGEEIIRSLQGPTAATILLNMSNIAWFGNSIALPQHLQASQMRALETGRPMLRATNTGMTAAINPDGTVSATLPPYTVGALNITVQGMQGLTPYARFGNWPTLGLIGLVILLGLIKKQNTNAETLRI